VHTTVSSTASTGSRRRARPSVLTVLFFWRGPKATSLRSQLIRRKVSKEEIEMFARQFKLEYFETSSKEMVGVRELFFYGAKRVLEKINSGEVSPYEEVT